MTRKVKWFMTSLGRQENVYSARRALAEAEGAERETTNFIPQWLVVALAKPCPLHVQMPSWELVGISGVHGDHLGRCDPWWMASAAVPVLSSETSPLKGPLCSCCFWTFGLHHSVSLQRSRLILEANILLWKFKVFDHIKELRCCVFKCSI